MLMRRGREIKKRRHTILDQFTDKNCNLNNSKKIHHKRYLLLSRPQHAQLPQPHPPFAWWFVRRLVVLRRRSIIDVILHLDVLSRRVLLHVVLQRDVIWGMIVSRHFIRGHPREGAVARVLLT